VTATEHPGSDDQAAQGAAGPGTDNIDADHIDADELDDADEPVDADEFDDADEFVDADTDDTDDPAAGPPSLQLHRPGAGPGTTTLLVVRHGVTTWGEHGRFAGREDVALTERGVAQARAVAARLAGDGVTAVVSSTLQRCRRTAEIIAAATGSAAVAVTTDDGLLDGRLGEWSGFTAAEIARKWPAEFEAWRSDPQAAPPGGESFAQVRDRGRGTVQRVLAAHRGGTVVLVTHAATTKMLLVEALAAPLDVAYKIRVDTCSISMITVDRDGATMVCSINDTGHLRGRP
jgi:probable phosphoglycerate mutase